MKGTLSFSDSRMKTNITDIADDESLNLCNQLKPKRYTYKDVVSNGTRSVIGFIAQEVKDILPEAIYQRKEYIPNIYQLATITDNILNFETDLSLSIISDVSGGKIKIYDYEDREQYIDISSATSNTMTMSDVSQLNQVEIHENKIFVYGEQVPDFHTIKKEMITPICVGAIQELDKKNKSLEKRIEDLEETIMGLMD